MSEQKYKLRGSYYTNRKGCLISSEDIRVIVHSYDTFHSLEEAKQEWKRDPWLEEDGVCVLADQIIRFKE